jgi:hypothetical protein
VIADGTNGEIATSVLDLGADRETRVHPCPKTTWCIESLDHAGPCVEVPRYHIPCNDFGPKRGKR